MWGMRGDQESENVPDSKRSRDLLRTALPWATANKMLLNNLVLV